MEILKTITSVLMVPVTMISPILIILGIVIFVTSFFKKDVLRKKAIRKTGLWIFISPFAVLFVLITLYGLSSMMINF